MSFCIYHIMLFCILEITLSEEIMKAMPLKVWNAKDIKKLLILYISLYLKKKFGQEDIKLKNITELEEQMHRDVDLA